MRDGKFKLIAAPRPELYDLENDPVEENNLYDDRRALAEKMTARLATMVKERGSTSPPGSRPDINPQVQAQLASLGYLGSARKRESSGRTPLPDPKDCIGTYTRAPGSSPLNLSCGPWRPADDTDIAPRPGH